jgi:hypothetical protein
VGVYGGCSPAMSAPPARGHMSMSRVRVERQAVCAPDVDVCCHVRIRGNLMRAHAYRVLGGRALPEMRLFGGCRCSECDTTDDMKETNDEAGVN